jgi:hypothetical protein
MDCSVTAEKAEGTTISGPAQIESSRSRSCKVVIADCADAAQGHSDEGHPIDMTAYPAGNSCAAIRRPLAQSKRATTASRLTW